MSPELTPAQEYANARAYVHLVDSLAGNMTWCRITGMSFRQALAEARKQFNAEVRAEADATPLPRK